jgi:hypothetical protein
MKTKTIITTLFAALVLLSGVPGAAVADHTDNNTSTPAPGDENGDDDSGIIEVLNELLEEFESISGSWDATLEEILIAVFFHPFKFLAQRLIQTVSILLTNTPTVHPNPAVEEIHQQTLFISYLLSGLVFTAAGLLHMIGPILGVSYQQVRKILPRVIVALVFGTVSLPLLQYAVEFSDALTLAFVPDGLTASIQQMTGLGAGLALIYVINAILLLAIAALFVIRAVYIMFGAAISPLLALMWSTPGAKKYADTFISGWFAALLIAPLDMLALRFSLALMQGQGANWIQPVSNWVIGVASLLLLLIIPYQVWSASQTALGFAYGIGNTIKKQVVSNRNPTYPIGFLPPEERIKLIRHRLSHGKEPLTGNTINEDNERGGYRE